MDSSTDCRLSHSATATLWSQERDSNSPAQKYRYRRHLGSSSPIRRNTPRAVCKLIARGVLASGIPASAGVLSAFLLLHSRQQATKFSQTDSPPRDLGVT